MNHVVAAAAGLVLDQPSFFSTRLKKLILPPSVSIFKFLLSHDRPLHSPRCSWVSRILSSQNLHSKSFLTCFNVLLIFIISSCRIKYISSSNPILDELSPWNLSAIALPMFSDETRAAAKDHSLRLEPQNETLFHKLILKISNTTTSRGIQDQLRWINIKLWGQSSLPRTAESTNLKYPNTSAMANLPQANLT